MADNEKKQTYTIRAPEISVRPKVGPDGLPIIRPRLDIKNPNAQPPVDRNAPIDFSAIEMMKNFPASLKKEASDIGRALLNPIETGESLFNIVIGGVQKLDPTGLTGDDKIKYANAVGKYYALKYGSFNAFKRELQNNPASVLSDASLFISGGAGLIGKTADITGKIGGKTKLVSDAVQNATDKAVKAGTAIDPTNVLINVPLTTAGQGLRGLDIGKNWADSWYGRGLKPSTSLSDKDASQIIRTGLDEGITLNKAGVDKAEARINNLSEKIDNLLDYDPSAKISPNVAIKYLDDIRKEASGPTYNRRKNMGDVDKVKNQALDSLNSYIAEISKTDNLLSARDLQTFKRSVYDEIDWDITKQGSQTLFEQKALRDVGRSTKEAIEEVAPSVKDLNDQLGNLLEAKPFFERAKRRVANRDIIGLNTIASTGTGGALGGGQGAFLAFMANQLNNPTVLSKSGIALHQYRNQPIKGLLENSTNWARGRNLLQTGGDLVRDDDNLLTWEEIMQIYADEEKKKDEELEDNE